MVYLLSQLRSLYPPEVQITYEQASLVLKLIIIAKD